MGYQRSPRHTSYSFYNRFLGLPRKLSHLRLDPTILYCPSSPRRCCMGCDQGNGAGFSEDLPTCTHNAFLRTVLSRASKSPRLSGSESNHRRKSSTGGLHRITLSRPPAILLFGGGGMSLHAHVTFGSSSAGISCDALTCPFPIERNDRAPSRYPLSPDEPARCD